MRGIGLQIGPLRGGVFVETDRAAVGLCPGTLLATGALPGPDVGDLKEEELAGELDGVRGA